MLVFMEDWIPQRHCRYPIVFLSRWRASTVVIPGRTPRDENWSPHWAVTKLKHQKKGKQSLNLLHCCKNTECWFFFLPPLNSNNVQSRCQVSKYLQSKKRSVSVSSPKLQLCTNRLMFHSLYHTDRQKAYHLYHRMRVCVVSTQRSIPLPTPLPRWPSSRPS